MITISLNEIRAQSPCESGWKKVIASKGGTSADMDAQFPMTDIFESNGLDDTLWCLRCRPEFSSLWRKFAVWAARQIESQMTDAQSINALEVAWRHSDGLATDDELVAARVAARAAVDAAWAAPVAARVAARAAVAAARAAAAAVDAARAAADAAWDAAVAAWDAAVAARVAADAVDAARAAADAAWDAAGDAADAAWDAAWDAQKQKLIQILTAGKWED